MRIVLLSYHFPPAHAVGGLRAAKDAAALRSAGHDVHVIAARVPEAEDHLERLPDGVVVERVTCWPSPRALALKLLRRLREARGPSRPTAASTSAPSAVTATVPAWKRWVYSLLWLPDDMQGYIIPAARAARRAFPGGPDLVLTSAPPFSVHLAGLLLAREGYRWIAEFRDPWTDNPIKTAIYRSGLSDRVERWLEGRTLVRAERIVAVTEGIARKLRGKLRGSAAERILLVRNGIEWLAPPRPRSRPDGPWRILHVGSCYGSRDPIQFLTALARVVGQYRLTPADLQVALVGSCRSYAGGSMEALVTSLGIQEFVQFRDWVPHDAARALIEQADVLLLLAQGQPDQVPNKLYEYLGSRGTILGFVDPDGESARMLRDVGGHVVVTSSDLAEAEAAVAQVLRLGPAPAIPAPAPTRLEEWTTAAQMRRFVQAVSG